MKGLPQGFLHQDFMKGSDYAATQEHNCIGKYLQEQEAEVRAKINNNYHLLIIEYLRTIFYENNS